MTKGKERIAIFIDGDNLFGTSKSLGWLIDFEKFRAFFAGTDHLYNVFYYMSWDEEDNKKNFAILLTNKGYTVKKRIEQKVMQYGELVATKGNTDIMMTVDILNTKKHYDTCILVTGDGDFLPVVECLRQQGKKIVVVSSKEDSASIDLVNAADSFIELLDIRKHIERERNV